MLVFRGVYPCGFILLAAFCIGFKGEDEFSNMSMSASKLLDSLDSLKFIVWNFELKN